MRRTFHIPQASRYSTLSSRSQEAASARRPRRQNQGEGTTQDKRRNSKNIHTNPGTCALSGATLATPDMALAVADLLLCIGWKF